MTLQIKQKIDDPSNRLVPIEEIFASLGRVRILKVLVTKGEMNISAISRITRVNQKLVKNYLNLLVKIGIIQEKVFGRIRIYRLCIEKPVVTAIKNLFDLWQRYFEKDQ